MVGPRINADQHENPIEAPITNVARGLDNWAAASGDFFFMPKPITYATAAAKPDEIAKLIGYFLAATLGQAAASKE